MARRNEAADQVERLSAECRRLATELRAQAASYAMWRRDDANEIRQIAGRLDALGDRVTELFSEGDAHGLRRAVRWVQRYSAVLILPAAALTGVAESAGSKVMDAIWADDEEATAVADAAQRTYDQACVVIELPTESLRPTSIGEPTEATGRAHGSMGVRGRASGVTGTPSIEDEPDTVNESVTDALGVTDSVDVELEADTASATGVAPDNRVTTSAFAGVAEAGASAGDATVTIEPAELRLQGVDVQASTGPPPHDEADVPEDHETSASVSVGVSGSAQVSKAVTLGQAVEDDSALPIDATARPATIEVAAQVPPVNVQASDDEAESS